MHICKVFSFIITGLISFNAVHAQKVLTPVDSGSKIHFKLKNFGFNTGGDMSGMKGSIFFNIEKPALSHFEVTVRSSSINTGNHLRDDHLKESGYLDVVKYPVILLKSTKVERSSAGIYKFTGVLTIKNNTKVISFPFTTEVHGSGYIFTGNFSINRKDYNVGNNSLTMSDDVKINLSILAK